MESAEKLEKYEPVKLPHDPWWAAGRELVLSPEITRPSARIGEWRFQEEGEGSGLFLYSGPPGVGKTVLARFTADAAVRGCGQRGNALIVHTPALFSEELGRSARLVGELFEHIELSASRYKTCVLWEDAEGIFCSRQQVIESRDPTDLLRVTATLNSGFDRLCEMKNVLQIATGNFAGELLDPAIVDRIDYVLSFRLPGFAERMEILRRRLNGLVGEGVVAELAAATEGWSGRRLAKIVMQAFLSGTARTRKEMTAEDFLRAVGVTPDHSDVMPHSHGNGADTPKVAVEATAPKEMVEEAAVVAATASINKEDERCQNGQNGSHSGFPQGSSPPPIRSRWPVRWFEKWAGYLAIREASRR